MEFLRVLSLKEVVEIIGNFPLLEIETIQIENARGRVLAEEVLAPEPVPHFRRATMDGYAVRSKDTFGASESLPAILEVTGAVEMGKLPHCDVRPNQAVSIPTGGAVPEGADAVLMVEYTEPIDGSTIEVYKPAAPGEHILGVGEDIPEGSIILEPGRVLKPQDIGTLASLGITKVKVYRKPRVGIISTGDEIVDYTTKGPLPAGLIRDANSLFITGLCEEAGAEVGERILVADDRKLLRESCRKLSQNHDVILISGGSSVGVRDFTLSVLKDLQDSSILFHGVAIKPGKPTMLAVSQETYFWGLPGQPTSALIVMLALVCPFLLAIQGTRPVVPFSRSTVEAYLESPIPSAHGREDFVPVRLSRKENKRIAQPVFGKSGMISLLTKADGLIIIPEHSEGFDKGTQVTVYLT